MSYSSTGYSSATLQLTFSAVPKVPCITLITKSGRGFIDLKRDFYETFSASEIQGFFNDPIQTTATTKNKSTSSDSDTVIFNYDASNYIVNTKTLTLSASQNESNEVWKVIILANPLIQGLHVSNYPTYTFYFEPEMTEQITTSGSPITSIDLKHAFLNNSYSYTANYYNVFQYNSAYLNLITNYIDTTTIDARYLTDNNFVRNIYRAVQGAGTNPNAGWRLYADANNIRFRLNFDRVYKYGRALYENTGKHIEIFGDFAYNSTASAFQNNQIKHDEKAYKTFTLQRNSAISTTSRESLSPYLDIGKTDTTEKYKALIKIENTTLSTNDAQYIKTIPRITSAEVDGTNSKKINLNIKNGISGGLNSYDLLVAGCRFNNLSLEGTQVRSKSGSLINQAYWHQDLEL